MLDKLIEIDKAMFLYLNSNHLDWLDPIMLALSSYAMWGVVFVLIGLLIFINTTRHKTVTVLFYAGAVVTSTLLTNALKLIVQRPRPIHEEGWIGVIHNIEKYSTASSFFSSHAATTFCIATFALLSMKTKKAYGYVAMLWAMCVSYSRIYVGKHYLGDVSVGILFGVFCGYMGYRLLGNYLKKQDSLSS